MSAAGSTWDVVAALDEVRGRIDRAAGRAMRSADSVALVAVGKGHGVDKIMEAHRAGQTVFGENRAQEMAQKLPLLPADVEMHFVGPLQTNKVRLVRPSVKLLHSLDRAKLAGAWVKGPGSPPPVLIEVNIAGEPQKAGVGPGEAGELIEVCLEHGIDVRGLMCIPPLVETPEIARPSFVALRELRDRLEHLVSLPVLSMGMTDDFEVAIEEGATMVRVGRAIFGPRPRR